VYVTWLVSISSPRGGCRDGGVFFGRHHHPHKEAGAAMDSTMMGDSGTDTGGGGDAKADGPKDATAEMTPCTPNPRNIATFDSATRVGRAPRVCARTKGESGVARPIAFATARSTLRWIA